jgi:hypothetical protein
VVYFYLFRVNIKPPRHRFGFSLAWGWQYASMLWLSFAKIGFTWASYLVSTIQQIIKGVEEEETIGVSYLLFSHGVIMGGEHEKLKIPWSRVKI